MPIVEFNQWAVWLGAVSIATFVGTLVALPIIIVRLPTDYFCRMAHMEHRERRPITTRRMVIVFTRNFFGWLLLAAGLLMLFLPGQGLLTMLLGITLVDFPGKQRLMHRLMVRLGVTPVIAQMNKIRHRFKRPPLHPPAPNKNC